MTCKIIENNKEAFIIYEGVITPTDACNYHVFELIDKDVKKTVDFTNVSCYNEFVVGLIEIFKQNGIPYKERKKDETKPDCE